MKEEVVKAVEALRTNGHVTTNDYIAIDKALRDQEAEIAGLRSDLRDADERSALRSRERTEAVQRAEQAEALLRDIKAWDVDGSLDPKRESLFLLPIELRYRLAHLTKDAP